MLANVSPALKWILIVFVLLGCAFGVLMVYSTFVTNPGVTEDLESNPQGERAGIAMLLTFADGRTIPVNYLREDDKVFVGADGPWWREFRGEGASVTLLIRGATFEGHAKVVLDDPAYTRDVFARLRPTAPAWLPDWLNGKLVVIELLHE